MLLKVRGRITQCRASRREALTAISLIVSPKTKNNPQRTIFVSESDAFNATHCLALRALIENRITEWQDRDALSKDAYVVSLIHAYDIRCQMFKNEDAKRAFKTVFAEMSDSPPLPYDVI
jgi:hypothetical protein